MRVQDLPSPWDYTGELTWLVDGFIPENAVTMLSGASGCGKSTFTLALAHAVASGQPFIGRATRKKPVLILDLENNESAYAVRLAQLGLERIPDLYVWGPLTAPPKTPLDPAIKAFVTEVQPLLIFDSLIAFHPGNEQDASETRKYLDMYRELSKNGATVLLIHHTGKSDGSQEYRGSSDIKASMDYSYLMRSKDDMEQITIEDKKHRLTKGKDVIPVRYADGKYLPGRDVRADLLLAFVAANPGAIESTIVAGVSEEIRSPNAARKLLHRLVESGRVVIKKGLKNASHHYIAGAQNTAPA